MSKPLWQLLWQLLDLFMHIIHLSAIFFLLVGWTFHETQLPHFVLAWLVFLSWFGLGLIYGFGYCLMTDVHWRIKDKLGARPSAKVYVKYMLDKVLPINIDEGFVDQVSTYVFFTVFAIANYLTLMTFLQP